MEKISAVLLMSLIAVTLSAGQKKSDEVSDYQSKSFSVQKGGLLDVDVEPGSVTIEPWSKDEVFIEAEGIDERHPDRLVMEQSGNSVSVRYRDSRHSVNHLEFAIRVPLKYNVTIQTSGGSVKQKEMLTGDFHVETKGGSIKIDHIIGNVDAKSGGGSIKSVKIEGDATMRTGGGSVETGMTTGVLRVSTGGGSISMRDAGGKVDASTGGGSIKLVNAGAWVDLSTGGGSVHVRSAKFGVKVKTGGGSIDMEDITGLVNASTGGGSIKCELTPGTSGNSSIRTGGGEIELSLPESAKVTVEATINLGHGWGRNHKKYSIRSDFKAEKYEQEKGGDIYAVYKLNGGGPTITLETSESDIEILKMPSH